MYTAINKYLFLLIVLMLFSCTEHEEIKTIGETEYYFDEKLSSISDDENGNFWVGSETGDIFNFKDNQRISFDLGEDRVYKIKRDVSTIGDTIFWIGIRNSGLQKWKTNKNNKLEKLETYTINFKQDRYSPYDFVCFANHIYVATSQGIYSLDKNNESDSLSLIYPSKEFLSKQNGNSFVVHNICQYNDSLLLASTQSGILLYNRLNHKNRLILKDHYIEHVSVYNDTIFAVSKNHLYLNNIKGDLIDKIKTGNAPKVYYQIQGIHYLVGSEELLLSNDLKDFLRIHLRRTIPMKCRNIILPDTLNNFTYLLTENAVWRIPNNIDVFKGNKSIKASCSNSDNVYYLSLQNELYVQNKNVNKAKWIYTFPDDNIIQWMDISGNELYFYNVNNKFQKMRISENWIKNIIFNSPQDIVQPEERITSANIKNIGGKTFVYLGIQDGMIIIDEKNDIDTVPQLCNAYITSMFGHTHTDRFYVSTLNDGVFYINQNNQIKQVPKTEEILFIKDIITTNDHNSNLIMLTNQQIISQTPNDSIRVKGYKKLLYVNDTLFYGLREFGFQKFIISKNEIINKGIFCKDMRINSNSAFSTDDKLILGSNVGALALSVGQEKHPVWIDFENAININILHSSLLALLILIVVSIIITYFIKRQNATIIQIKKHKEDLIKRLHDLTIFYSILDETENIEVSRLKDQINSIEVSSKYKNEINTKIEGYSLQIAKLNRRVALLIPKKLEDQIAQITLTDSFEKVSLLKLSNEAQTQNDIELIKDQVRSNESWLQQRSELFNMLELNIDKLSDCVEIEGVNKDLYNNLISIKQNDKHKLLSDLKSSYALLEKGIAEINSIAATDKINSYIDTTRTYLESKLSKDKGLSFIMELLNDALSEYSNDNITLLKNLKVVDKQILVLKCLDEIKSLTIEYKEKHDRIINENNEQINKKFDKELASLISDSTQDITRSINTLISSLYNHLLETDKHIVVDILKLTNIEGQHAKVLALLIANLKIKRTLIPGLLGIYGNLNPVISRLINDRIRINETILKTYQNSTKNKSVFGHLILLLLN